MFKHVLYISRFNYHGIFFLFQSLFSDKKLKWQDDRFPRRRNTFRWINTFFKCDKFSFLVMFFLKECFHNIPKFSITGIIPAYTACDVSFGKRETENSLNMCITDTFQIHHVMFPSLTWKYVLGTYWIWSISVNVFNENHPVSV